MKPIEDRKYTVEEYFQLVEDLDYKIEYHDGKIVAMAGGTANHSIISTNFLTLLNIELRNKDCIIYNSDMQLAVRKQTKYVFPDAMVVCGEPKYEDARQLSLINPSLIIEVSSKSTELYDRKEKFRFYRSLPSFKEYIIVNSTYPLVESFFQEQKDLWRINSAVGLEESFPVFSLDLEFKMKDLYAKTQDLEPIPEVGISKPPEFPN